LHFANFGTACILFATTGAGVTGAFFLLHNQHQHQHHQQQLQSAAEEEHT